MSRERISVALRRQWLAISRTVIETALLFALTFTASSFAQESMKNSTVVSGEVDYLVAGPDSSMFAGVLVPGPSIKFTIYVTTDKGNSWTERRNGLPNDGGSPVFSDTTNYVYATGDSGFYRSGVHDTAWVQVLSGGSGNVIQCVVGNSLGLLIAGTYGGQIYRSTDHGDSWQQTYYAVDTGAHTTGTVYSLAIIKPSDIIAAISAYRGPSWMVRSTDGGSNWVKFYPQQGPVDFNRLWINAFTGSVFGTELSGGGLYRSTDDGTTWTLRDSTFVIYTSSSIAFDASGNLYASTNDGVSVSSDEGVHWQNINQNLPFIGAQSIAVGLDGYLYVAEGDSGVWKSTAKVPAANGGWENVVKVTSINNHGSNNPDHYALYQNYPNPFNPTTTISYDLSSSGFVSLKVYDVLGRELETLVNEHQNVGKHFVKFNASSLPSGVYFFRLQAGTFIEARKLTVLK